MADKTQYLYSEPYTVTLPGGEKKSYRTVTEYKIDNNGRPVDGGSKTTVYTSTQPGGRTPGGQAWSNGTAISLDNFNQGGWVEAATTTDGGASYTYSAYTEENQSVGIIPSNEKVGNQVLEDIEKLSLSTSGGIFYEATQSALLATNYKARNAEENPAPSGLGNIISAKQKNTTAEEAKSQVSGTTLTPINNLDVGTAKARTDYGTYYYPEEIVDNKQDRIIFTMRLSQGSVINPNLGEQTVKRKNTKGTIQGSVTLPIQPSITDSNSVDWQGSSMNALYAFAAGQSVNFMRDNKDKDFGAKISAIMGQAAAAFKTNKDYTDALQLYLAQEAVGIQGLVARATGAIVNPNMELLFNAPSLRPFTFTFRLSPRSSTEATQVRNIIRFFKQGMSVKTTDTSIFLKAPNVFDIRYESYDKEGKVIKDHPSLNRIKTCALTACDVNYTPDGTYMTFNDEKRTMTSYEISLRFTELDPVYDSDYDEKDAEKINGLGEFSGTINRDEIGF